MDRGLLDGTIRVQHFIALAHLIWAPNCIRVCALCTGACVRHPGLNKSNEEPISIAAD